MKKEFEDDGRVVADMSNVPGAGGGLRDFILDKKKNTETKDEGSAEDVPQMSKEDRRAYIIGAMGASLLIGLTFIVAAGIIIVLLMWLWGVFG